MADEIRQFVVGDIETNCYAYVSQGQALVVDPGAQGAYLAEALNDVDVVWVVATHCHHDHVCGIRALTQAMEAPWAISAADAKAATDALARSVHATPEAIATFALEDPPAPDRLLSEGDVLSVGTARFVALETPGHTPGGMVLVGLGTAEGIAFMGDTLFAGSCGRTDLVGGDRAALMASLGRLVREIPAATTLLCGHGAVTTMAVEIASNPWLQQAQV